MIKNEYTTIPQNHSLMTCHKTYEIDNISNIQLDDIYKARDLINIIRAKDCLGKSVATFSDKGKTYKIQLHIELDETSNET
jgi:hypothetical protein